MDYSELKIDNYIIVHHLDDRVYQIPMYPEEVSDTMSTRYVQTEILARSAPLQSWSNAGPRTLGFSLKVHRDLDDYVTAEHGINDLINDYQAFSLPNYSSPMLVIPPKITVSLGPSLRITGIPSNISYTNRLPIGENGEYMSGEFIFEIKELEPYDAESVASSYHNARGLTKYENNL